MTLTTPQNLPPYPSISARKSLSPLQLTKLNQDILRLLARVLALPSPQDAASVSQAFILSYAKHVAVEILQSLVWDTQPAYSKIEKTIRIQVLLLAEKIAFGIGHETLVDLAIIYAPSHPTRTRALFASALEHPCKSALFSSELLTAFTKLLATWRTAGLYGLRKTAHCLGCVLHAAPSQVTRHLSCNRNFIVALASAYDESLTSIAHSYGGLRIDSPSPSNRHIDEWERIWLETKVALFDSFHVLADQMIKDLSQDTSSGITDQIFDILFHLLDTSSHTRNYPDTTSTPFLNRPLMADYEHAYALSQRLASLVTKTADRDPRLDLIEATLASLKGDLSQGGSTGVKDPGALILLLRASGHHPDPVPAAKTRPIDKGKSKATTTIPPEPASHLPPDPELDLKIAQVREILPDYPIEYIHALLTHPAYPFRGNAEKVVEALLEGTAPSVDAVERESGSRAAPDEFIFTKGRQNAFDGDDMDLSLVRLGKKVCVSVIRRF